MISILAQIGIVLGALALEAILLIILEIPAVKRFNKRIRNKVRHWFWYNFNFTSDYKEKE